MKSYILALLVGAGALLSTACEDDVQVGTVDETNYQLANDALGYIADQKGNRSFPTLEFRSAGDVQLTLHARQAASQNIELTAVYDASVLEAYNQANDTEFEAIPQSDITLSDAGVFTLVAGAVESTALNIHVVSDGSRDHSAAYAIPLRFTASNGAVLPVADQTKIVWVTDLTGLATGAAKVTYDSSGNPTEPVFVFSCMEVNDTNPLNNLCFTLSETGAPLIDGVILFSSNINYNAETGRVYVYHNENCTAIFNNRAKYLKPLKDRGMKVYLSILGNHDASGVANLADETAREYAKEVKAICDAYDLDGVMLDDEYSDYAAAAGIPGFVTRSYNAIARLYYEMKKIMPTRDMIVYQYGYTPSGVTLTEEDGTQIAAGEYIDYVLHDYGQSSDVTSRYPGLPYSHLGLYSQEYTGRSWCSDTNLQRLVNNGSRTHMIFAMDPNRSNYSRQLQSMQSMARIFYGEQLVVEEAPGGGFYQKDWN
ncbi:MAG: DUF1735 domain-containing protein [Alloprevotella sp.]|nr:DUF1735 domain-containing protein [Alloprevotella sp.]